jgi:hypothetical protein
MNQRIRELMDEAIEFRLDPDSKHYEAQVSPEELEMFAELIVLECASICEINGQSYKHSFTPAKARLAESTSNHCAMMINKYFGVE